jgi:hypothetical protein
MNSYDLLERLGRLRNLIDNKSPIVKIIKGIANQSDMAARVINLLERISEQDSDEIEKQESQAVEQNEEDSEEENYHQSLQYFSQHIRRRITIISPKQFFVGISSLEEAIDEIVKELGKNSNPFAGLRTRLANFSRKYELFFQNDSYSAVIDIVYSANSLVEDFGTILKFIDALKINLIGHVEYGESFRELSIFLNSSYSCQEFIDKLDSIQTIYSELCLLLNVSETEYPLRIIKIESGSLFARIFGESKVIGIFGSLIKDTVSFLYRRYTNEGRIEAISKQAEAIEKVLELNRKLEHAGIDTAESKEVIRKSAVIIADKLNHLLLGEPEIELNGEFISLDGKLKQKYLEENRVYLLKGDDSNQEKGM